MNRLLQIFKIKDLRNKILIVAGLLVAYRVLAAIPIPGVDAARLQNYFNSNQLFGFLNFFSGGGLSNLSIMMLGVGPYITATIIMQLLTMIFPKFKEMYYEEGARGQAKFNQYSRLLTVPLAVVNAYGFLTLLISQGVIDRPAAFSYATNILVSAAGSMIALWRCAELSAAQSEPGGHDPTHLRDLRFALSAVPGMDRFYFFGELGVEDQRLRNGVRGEPALLRHLLFLPRFHLYVFLYVHHVQSGGGGEEPPAERRLCTGHPARGEHAEVLRNDREPYHVLRRGVPGAHCGFAYHRAGDHGRGGAYDQRHGDLDRGGGGA